MEYEIVTTNYGPIVKYDGKHLTLQDTQDLLMIQEENEGFIADMKVHIRTSLHDAHDEAQQAFEFGYPFVSTKLYPYLNAINLYQSFAFQTWPQYQQQLKQAQGNPQL
jgi:hypothetical protein